VQEKPNVKMVYVLVAAVAAAAAVGGARSLAGTPPTAAADAPITAVEEARDPAAPEGEAAEPGASLEGEVLEAIEVPNYTYLRIGEKGTDGTWAAVPTAGLEAGDHARVRDAMKMSGFTSTALKRTFPVIYFGTLEGGRRAHGMTPVDPSRNPHANGAGPHAASAVAADVKPVGRAKGESGRTVAEVIAQRAQLVGKTVRIHATVVKSTPGVLGKTYLHLRDGSGDAASGTNDVAVTTDTTPAVGDTVLVEGVVAIDRDIGAGYKFPTIVEDARLTQP
jgi:hypothetical protein